MEGNECYKFATIRHFINLTHADPVRVAIDVGANVGTITRMMKDYFPDARVHAFEAVPGYAALAEANTRDLEGVTVSRRAITAEHVFHDDFGERRRAQRGGMRVLKGMPASGPGWAGGSLVVPADCAAIAGGSSPEGYQLTDDEVAPLTLDEVVADVLTREGVAQIDILKLDCEGCEHSSLGSAAEETLRRLRFVAGEYHGIERFYTVMERALYRTHKVNLIGQRDQGAFFAERLDGTRDGILRYDRSGMRVPRPWLSAGAIDWHLFNDAYVPPGERQAHALP